MITMHYMCLACICDGLCVERPVSGMRGPEMDLNLHGHNPPDHPLPRNPSEPHCGKLCQSKRVVLMRP
jgi:hypothetical protein